ncbi:hypothetical protein B0H14DRAFT_2581404 [Mycena olivaceomarginata]|nr:hypothetical protein B0H14DRAFT_2581404 [Mycena olivaceomarginata]
MGGGAVGRQLILGTGMCQLRHTYTQTRRLAGTSCASVAFFWPLPSFRIPPATIDDIQLVASFAEGDLLAFRDSLRAFFASRNVSTSTCQSPISVKLEPSQAFVSIRPQESRVKTEDSGSPTIDLTSLARPAIRIDFEGWDTDIVFTEAELPILPPPPVSSPYSSPAALQVISPPPIEVLNADIDERNIVHFSRALNPTKRIVTIRPGRRTASKTAIQWTVRRRYGGTASLTMLDGTGRWTDGQSAAGELDDVMNYSPAVSILINFHYLFHEFCLRTARDFFVPSGEWPILCPDQSVDSHINTLTVAVKRLMRLVPASGSEGAGRQELAMVGMGQWWRCSRRRRWQSVGDLQPSIRPSSVVRWTGHPSSPPSGDGTPSNGTGRLSVCPSAQPSWTGTVTIPRHDMTVAQVACRYATVVRHRREWRNLSMLADESESECGVVG